MPRRKRSHPVVELLEKYRNLLSKTILCYQDPVTGLLPPFITKDGSPGGQFEGHAWVRDNVYCVLSIWCMSLALRSHGEGEEDRQTADELEKNSIKLMRSVLQCMLQQVEKVEHFKKSLNKDHSLHAKFNMSTCGPVVGDSQWGHLQIDATSLFLLVLAQMTASGVQVIYNLDEVAFIQNLIFYIETAYRTPDYGIWERGDKTNHGQTELNSTSIGMAKAALEAMSGLDLFGARGGPASVIHVLSDQVAQCNTKLSSLLPRESSSKEIDAGLLSVISFPAFAIESEELIQETRQQILDKLLGKYGCKRFLRDGYQTVREDSSRLHYESAELKIFENIECEWPLFLIYLLIDAIINDNHNKVVEYRDKLDSLVLHKDGGIETVPELYFVPWEYVESEYLNPHSQTRKVGLKVQSMWSQSLYILAGLLQDGLVNIGEIDPLNRRLCTLPKPEPIVQVVLLSEDNDLCTQLKEHGIRTRTIQSVSSHRISPVSVLPAKLLGEAYQQLGRNNKMQLSGRYKKIVGVLSTSILYSLREKLYAFYPSFLDHEAFYFSLDNELLVDLISTDLSYLKSNWRLMGCPLLTLPILWSMLGDVSSWDSSPVFNLLKKLNSGYTNAVRVEVGDYSDFMGTCCEERISFLEPLQSGIWTNNIITARKSTSMLPFVEDVERSRTFSDTSPLAGVVKRSRVTPTGDRRADLSISFSPSLRHLKVARGYSSRSHSYSSSKFLPTSNQPHPQGGGGGHRRERSVMATLDISDLIKELQTTTNVFDQADILHFLHDYYGKDYDTGIGGGTCTVETLLEELYEKVGFYRHWSLVRHTAGMLRKTIEDISHIVTDLLVRQKTIALGQPNHEMHITQPLPQQELLEHIRTACGKDYTAVALTQELLVYLAMFIRTEPYLFNGMLRLRIGLIQNVMTAELARSLNCSNEEGVEQLLLLSPYELKNLLHHLLNRKEFTVGQSRGGETNDTNPDHQLSIVTSSKRYTSGKLKEDVKALELGEGEEEEGDRHGQWRRRRRIDGALNRVPPDFYKQVWHCLEKCDGFTIGNQVLRKYPTIHEMTAGELKFVLKVETILNSLPDPEYRQLVVEVLMIIGLINTNKPLPQVVNVDDVIKLANQLFIDDQIIHEGVAMNCCGVIKGRCDGYWSICTHFYDSAPSGVYGTMNYLSRALLHSLKETLPPSHSCKIS